MILLHQTQQVYFLLKPFCKVAQLPQIHATRGELVKDVGAMYMELQFFQDVIYKNYFEQFTFSDHL